MQKEVYLVNDDIHPDKICVFSSIAKAFKFAKKEIEDEKKNSSFVKAEFFLEETDTIDSLDSQEELFHIEYKNYTKYFYIQLCVVDEYAD